MDNEVGGKAFPVVAYCRVSTQEQVRGGVSLAAQQAAIKRYAAARELHVVEIVTDAGVSAGTPLSARPGGARVFQAIESGEATGVVALKLDRIFRDAIDALGVTRSWDRSGVTLHLVDQNIDTGSAMGRMFLTVLAALAELERGLIAERTAAALAQVKAEGGRIGPEAFGWRRREELDESGRRIVEPVADEIEVARRMVELHETGASYEQVAQQMNEEGWLPKQGTRWYRGTVRRVILRYQREEILARVA